MIKPGLYQHFKGNFYMVLHIAQHSETEEYMVVYHPKDDSNSLWVRPLTMFDQTIERGGEKLKRFKFVETYS